MGYGEYVPRVGSKIERKLEFKIAGGVRLGPSTQIGAWLAQGLRKHVSKESTFTMESGSESPLDLVASGKADLCYSTKHGATAAYLGTGGKNALGSLRAICCLPKRDWYQFAVPAAYGITSIRELAQNKCPIRLAVPAGPTLSKIGKLQHLILSFYGIEPRAIEVWGGKLIIGESSRPHEHIGRVLSNEADSVFEDGIAVNHWWRLFAQREMVILPIEDDALAVAHKELGYRATIIPKGWYHGKTPGRDVITIDSSGFLVLVNESMDDELAHLLAKCGVQYKAEIEAEFNFMPVEQSSLTYPLLPLELATSTGVIPLHKGAEKYYRESLFL